MTNTAPIAPASAFSRLQSLQNEDGGWGYGRGSSWTEPTALAVLAAEGDPQFEAAATRARQWLLTNQRGDGGFSPRPSVRESTWVTALAVLARVPHGDGGRRAIQWMLTQTNRDSSLIFRLRQWMLGNQHLAHNETPGWSWYPGTAGWVVPTSLTVLALRSVQAQDHDPRIDERLRQGRAFLLSRMCEDGGWNHGSTRALGYQAVSYPETTGIALLAMGGVNDARLSRSLARAEEHFRKCRSLEGLSWLQLGLLAHGRPVPEVPAEVQAHTVMDLAVSAIAANTRQGRGGFRQVVR